MICAICSWGSKYMFFCIGKSPLLYVMACFQLDNKPYIDGLVQDCSISIPRTGDTAVLQIQATVIMMA